MKRMALIGCLLIFGLTQPAQQGSAWPPDPAILFTDAVTVVKTELVELQAKIIAEGRKVRIAGGKEYAVPEQYTIDLAVQRSVDDTIFLRTEFGYERWLRLNLRTGEFSRYLQDAVDTRCGSVKLVELDRTWVFVTDAIAREIRLCEMETGWKSAPLPSGYTWEVYLPGHVYPDATTVSIEVSPDRARLVFLGEVPRKQEFAVFSYEIKTGKLINNGLVESGNCLGVEPLVDWDRWVDNSTLLIFTWGGLEQCYRGLWVVDATRSNSAELGLGDRFDPEYYDDPPRLEAHYSSAKHVYSDETGAPCSHEVYYIKTRTLKTYTYGDLCIAEYGPQDGTGYYRAVAKDRKTATLVRFNPVTRQRASLYRGEIEQVLWVSGDERYAALVFDDNGKIDIQPGVRGDDQGQMGHSRLTILNLATGKKLYEREAEFTYEIVLGSWSPEVWEISTHELLLASFNPRATSYLESQEKYTVLSIKTDGITETRISEDGAGVILGKGQLLLWTDGMGKSTGLTLYDIATVKRTPLVNGLTSYEISIQEIAKGAITLDIYPAGENEYSYSRRARYTLRLPSS